MDYFIADNHWHHANIITYCGRPFKDVLEMDEYMITKWNEAVKPEDTVYHLGDLCLHYAPAEKEMLWKKLNGTKFLVLGNHDHKTVGHHAKLGIKAFTRKTPIVYKNKWYLSHQPMDFPDMPNIHGHSHGNIHRGEVPEHGIHVCVSVEVINYTPVPEEWVHEQIWKARMNGGQENITGSENNDKEDQIPSRPDRKE